MNLEVKPIINELFCATIKSNGVIETAVGHSQDEAATKALSRLKQILEEEIDTASLLVEDEDFEDSDEVKLEVSYILCSSVWDGLAEKTKSLAVEVGKIAIQAAIRSAVVDSAEGSLGDVIFCFPKTTS